MRVLPRTSPSVLARLIILMAHETLLCCDGMDNGTNTGAERGGVNSPFEGLAQSWGEPGRHRSLKATSGEQMSKAQSGPWGRNRTNCTPSAASATNNV